MDEPKLTPWFPANVRPARDGLYQVQIKGRTKWAKWRGVWLLALPTRERALAAITPSNDCRTNKFGGWRGLAKEPK